MNYRVAVTGMGVVSPIGCRIADFQEHLLQGRSGAGPITLFDASALPTRIAAEVNMARGGDSLRDRKISFVLHAAEEAMNDASSHGNRPGARCDKEEAAVSLGIGLELFSMEDATRSRRPGFSPPRSLRDRLTFLQTPSDISLHLLSRIHGLHAPPVAHVSACAAGSDAIGTAFRAIASGRRRWMIAGGTDSMINPMGVAGFCSIGALSAANDHPEGASRPFDRLRDGFVLGEGAGVLILERMEDAAERGADVHAEIVGYGNSFDAHGISEPHPEGRGAYQAMFRALSEAGISPDRIDCINAHGTGTPKNDRVETLAIKRLFGERARAIPVCATKSMIGHLVSAAGAVEAIAAIVCMKSGQVHPTINLANPDPECDLDYVSGGARRCPQRYVLSNSFGFGGQNASLVLKNVD